LKIRSIYYQNRLMEGIYTSTIAEDINTTMYIGTQGYDKNGNIGYLTGNAFLPCKGLKTECRSYLVIKLSRAGKSASEHMNSWSEKEANTLSFYMLNLPRNWNHSYYPINEIYLNAIRNADWK
jgi:hypothetical protein